MPDIKIVGAGSIGNHLANASRTLDYNVDLVDKDPAALERTKNEIYPSRYGVWDLGIKLHTTEKEPKNKKYDFIFIGTPPDSHIKLALKAVEELPCAVVIEKPLCGLDFEGLDLLVGRASQLNVRLFMGYDHAVSKSFEYFLGKMKNRKNSIKTFDISFREHWGGIFEAHPWLDGPHDSYLGYFSRGGGALAEHSHGLHMWVVLAHFLGFGNVSEVNADIQYFDDGKVNYDEMSFLNLKTSGGMIGRCVHDVVTSPTRKEILITTNNSVETLIFEKKKDIVYSSNPKCNEEFNKSRPDDFICEIEHLQKVIISGGVSALDIEFGVETMKIIAAAHKSSSEKKTISL
jgi:predicted dehydrogenase